MKFNEHIAIATPKVLLVPYDAHHVPHYHQWMEDAAIREATASDRLTLEEEYENQVSWRTSADKLTFIVCKPLTNDESTGDEPAAIVVAGQADRDERMVGDINLFLTPWEDDEEQDYEGDGKDATQKTTADAGKDANKNYCVGEVDIMIADAAHRGKGIGKAAVSSFLWCIRKHVGEILSEYAASTGEGSNSLEMKELLVRIKATNKGSIALFKGLRFEQRGEVNYFGEIEMVLKNLERPSTLKEVEGHRELVFDRSKLVN